MARSKKNEWREIALLNSLCPGLIQGPVSYEKFVGLWLNRSEMIHQQAFIALLAGTYSNSLADIPAEIFLAVHEDEATAFEQWSATNSARSDAAAKQKPQGQQTHQLFG